MLERRMREYFDTVGLPRPHEVRLFTDSVARGLGLEDAMERRQVDYEVIDEMIREIAITSIYCGNFLDNSGVPDFGLIYPWDEKAPITVKDGSDDEILADSGISPDNPSGIIRYAPHFLEHIANYKMGSDDPVDLRYGREESLIGTQAHEEFHLGQYFRFPKTMFSQVVKAAACAGSLSEELDVWEKTWAERGARKFEKLYLDLSPIFATRRGKI